MAALSGAASLGISRSFSRRSRRPRTVRPTPRWLHGMIALALVTAARDRAQALPALSTSLLSQTLLWLCCARSQRAAPALRAVTARSNRRSSAPGAAQRSAARCAALAPSASRSLPPATQPHFASLPSTAIGPPRRAPRVPSCPARHQRCVLAACPRRHHHPTDCPSPTPPGHCYHCSKPPLVTADASHLRRSDRSARCARRHGAYAPPVATSAPLPARPAPHFDDAADSRSTSVLRGSISPASPRSRHRPHSASLASTSPSQTVTPGRLFACPAIATYTCCPSSSPATIIYNRYACCIANLIPSRPTAHLPHAHLAPASTYNASICAARRHHRQLRNRPSLNLAVYVASLSTSPAQPSVLDAVQTHAPAPPSSATLPLIALLQPRITPPPPMPAPLPPPAQIPRSPLLSKPPPHPLHSLFHSPLAGSYCWTRRAAPSTAGRCQIAHCAHSPVWSSRTGCREQLMIEEIYLHRRHKLPEVDVSGPGCAADTTTCGECGCDERRGADASSRRSAPDRPDRR